MQFQFDFHSDPIIDLVQFDAVVQHWIDDNQLPPVGVQTEVVADSDHCLHIVVLLDLDEYSSSEQVQEFTNDLLALFERLAERFDLGWNVGHALDTELGRVAKGVQAKPLVDELCVAIQIARSFADPNRDDQWNDRVPSDHGSSGSHDAAWEELFLPPDSFVRFRELE